MAKTELTGEPIEWFEQKKEEFEGTEDEWKQRYCLSKIPYQPKDYDGPRRYCKKPQTMAVGNQYRCKFHGGARENATEPFEKLAAMKHGMSATREHLVEDFDEKDQALYDWITESYPDAYDINVEEDPSAAYDLHRLAAEIVRAERGRGFLIREGEVKEQEVRTEEGQIVLDENGDIVTEKSQHYLADMMYQQDNKITKLEKELGITRKEQLRQDSSGDAVEALTKGFAELGAAFLERDEKDYDPDEKPWETDDAD